MISFTVMHINLVLSKSAEEVNDVKMSFLHLCSFNKLACLSIMQKYFEILILASHHRVTQEGGAINSKLCPL